MPAITLQVTNAGRAALVAAGTAGTLPVTITQVGLSAATTVVPAAGMTALAGEHRRIGAVGGAAIAADTIHLTARDESSASYSVAAIALYLADGTMFAVYGQNTAILSKSASAIMLLAVDVKFADIAASSLTFGNTNFLNPPATTEVQGVVELATNAEALTGTDSQRAIVPASLKHVFDQRLGAFVQKTGDIMTGQLVMNTGSAEPIKLRHASAALAGYDAAGSTRHGYIQFNAGNAVLASDAGSVLLAPGGVTKFSIAAATGFVTLSGGALIAGAVTAQTGLQVTGSFSVNPNGAGLEITHAIGTSFLQSYDRVAGAYLPLQMQGSVIQMRPNGGTVRLAAHSTGVDVTGSLAISGGTSFGDGAFTAYLSGTSPLIQWESNNYDYFSRTTDTRGFVVGSSQIVAITAAGLSVTGTGSFTGAVTLAAGAKFGDVSFEAAIDGSGPYIQGDTSDLLRFYRASDTWSFIVAGGPKLNVSAAGVGVAGSLSASGAITQAGNQVWHVGNDGAGSGLDADLLDGFNSGAFARHGQDVSFRDVTASRGDGTGVVFLNTANTRYLYFDGSSYVLYAAQLVVNGGSVWTAANDGAGSGLDADLLDGLQASQFWRPDNDGPGSGLDADLLDGLQASQFWRPDNDGNGSGLDADLLDGLHANQFWRPDTDGAGSGLDADLLDGMHADQVRNWANILDKPASFPPSAHTHAAADIAGAFASLKSENGYLILPGGIIVQWCTTAGGNGEGTFAVSFPIAFPNACLTALPIANTTSYFSDSDAWLQLVGNPTTIGCTIGRQYSDGGTGIAVSARVIAIGH